MRNRDKVVMTATPRSSSGRQRSYFTGRKSGRGLTAPGSRRYLRSSRGRTRSSRARCRWSRRRQLGYLQQEPPLPDDATFRRSSTRPCSTIHDLMDGRLAGRQDGRGPRKGDGEDLLQEFGKGRKSWNEPGLGARRQARHGHRRRFDSAAPGRRHRAAVRRRELGVALFQLLRGSPTCCCSISRRTTSTPTASAGWKTTCRSTPAP